LEVVVIPARVDEAGETDEQNRFRDSFLTAIKTPEALKDATSSSWELLIPYVTKYAYTESLAVGRRDSNQRLENAYRNLAVHLALLSKSDSRLRTCLSAELLSIRRASPRVYLLEDGSAPPVKVQSRMPGIDFTGSSSEAASIIVFFSGATLTDGVKQQIRQARQRGACLFGLRTAEYTGPLPKQLERIPIHSSADSLDALARQLRAPCQTIRAPQMSPTVLLGFVPIVRVANELKSLFLDANLVPKNGRGGAPRSSGHR
jgi:hypothetical protein